MRDLARQTGIPSGSLAGYFSGRHLPPATRPEVLTKIVAACGCGPEEVTAWLGRLTALHQDRRRAPAPQTPYRGLAGFAVDDADLLFGREELCRQLVETVDQAARAGGGIVLVVGPSGTGKSSLLRAGLIPALLTREDPEPWTFAMGTPGADLAGGLDLIEGTGADGGRRRLLILDQMEEVFTLTADEDERAGFIQQLTHWVADGEAGECRVVVLGLRADRYGDAAAHPELLEAMRHRQVLVPPMSTEELRSVIEGPARQVNLRLDWGLAEVILTDLRTGDLAHALPHLSHTLQAMWEVSDHRTLRIRDYKAVGGVTGAVRRSAERALGDLTTQEQELARSLLLQLVVVHPEAGPSRRVASRDSLSIRGPAAERVLDHLVRHRLLTVTEDEVSISHEALIEGWPRLRQWVDEDRSGLILRDLLVRQKRTWRDHGYDPDLLLRGSQLEAVEEWAQRDTVDLTDPQQAYLRESREHWDQRQRERERQHRRTRSLLVASLIFAVIAAGLGALAWRGQREVSIQRDTAQSRQMATVASTLRTMDIPLANQIALASVQSADTIQARSALLDATSLPVLTRRIDPDGVVTAASNEEGTLLALGAANGSVDLVQLSDAGMTDAGSIRLTDGPEGQDPAISAITFSPDGRHIALAGGLSPDGTGTVRLVDVDQPGAPTVVADLAVDRAVFGLAFSRDGRHLFAAADPEVGSADGAVLHWRAAGAGWASQDPLTGLDGSVRDVATSPDGAALAATTFSGDVVHWDLTGEQPTETDTLRIGSGTTSQWSVDFAPGGGLLAVVGKDQTLRLLTVSGSGELAEQAALEEFDSWVNTVAFSRNGRLVAAGSSDSTVRLWDLADPAVPRLRTVLPVSSPVTSLTALPGEEFIVTTTDDKSYVWDTSLGTLPLHEAIVFVTRASTEGDRLLTAPGVGDGRLYLWDITDRRRPGLLTTLEAPDGLGVADGAGAISHDGTMVATGTSTGGLVVWDVTDPAAADLLVEELVSDVLVEQVAFTLDDGAVAAVGGDGRISVVGVRPGAPATESVEVQDSLLSVAAAPDGGLLAAGDAAGTVTLWDAAALGSEPLASITADRTVFGLDFDVTGTRLAVAGTDSTVRIFDVSDPTSPDETTAALTGPTTTVYSVEFSPDGQWLAAAALDGSVWVWQRAGDSYTRSAILRSASASLNAVGWGPDSTHLFAGGHGGETRLWLLDVEEAEDYICRTGGDEITPQEWETHLQGVPYAPPCPGPGTSR